jgi:hypothetical protein
MFRRRLNSAKILRHIQDREPAALLINIRGKKTKIVVDSFSATAPSEAGDFVYRICGVLPDNDNRPVELHYFPETDYAWEAQKEPVGKLANAIIQQALVDGTSAVRITAKSDAVVVEHLVGDGWVDKMRIPTNLREATFARYREMAGSAGPFRDGKGIIQVTHQGNRYDLLLTEERDTVIHLAIEHVAGPEPSHRPNR